MGRATLRAVAPRSATGARDLAPRPIGGARGPIRVRLRLRAIHKSYLKFWKLGFADAPRLESESLTGAARQNSSATTDNPHRLVFCRRVVRGCDLRARRRGRASEGPSRCRAAACRSRDEKHRRFKWVHLPPVRVYTMYETPASVRRHAAARRASPYTAAASRRPPRRQR